MAKIVRQADGNYVAIKGDGTRVALTSEQLDNLARPTQVLNEQGITLGQRFQLKNFTGNREGAISLLKSWGYQVRRYGRHPVKLQFAIRKGSSDPWKVVDPDGFEPEDLLDLSMDVVQGAAITAATAATGGIGGAILAGAAAGGGTELLRQGIGAELGAGPENIDPTQIAAQTVGGGLAEPLAVGTKFVVGQVSKAALDMGARVAGIKASAGMVPEEALTITALRKPGLFKAPQMPSFQDVATKLHNFLQNRQTGLLSKRFPEALQLDEMLLQAKNAGVKVDLTPVIAKFEGLLVEPGEAVEKTVTRRIITEAEAITETKARRKGFKINYAKEKEAVPFDVGVDETAGGLEGGAARRFRDITTRRTTFEAPPKPKSLAGARAAFREEVNPAQVQQKIDEMMRIVEAAAEADGGAASLRQVSPEIANMLRQDFQALARTKKTYTGLPVPLGYKQALREAATEIRSQLIKQMGGEQSAFAQTLGIVHKKTIARDALIKALKSPDDLRDFLEKVYGKYNSRALRAIMDLEDQFGITILPEIRSAQAAVQVGKRGAAPGTLPLLPRLSATGAPVLAGTIGVSGYFGGPAAMGAVLAATSPKTVVAATRLGMQAAKVLDKPAVAQSVRAAAFQTLQESAALVGKGMSREREAKRKRRVVIGGA